MLALRAITLYCPLIYARATLNYWSDDRSNTAGALIERSSVDAVLHTGFNYTTNGTHILQSEKYREREQVRGESCFHPEHPTSLRQLNWDFGATKRLFGDDAAELWAEIEVAAERVRGFIPLQRQSSSCARILASRLVAAQMQQCCCVKVPLCCCCWCWCCYCCCLSLCLVTSQAPLSSFWECFVLQVLVLGAEVVESFDWTMTRFATRLTLRRQSRRRRRLCLRTSASKQKTCSPLQCERTHWTHASERNNQPEWGCRGRSGSRPRSCRAATWRGGWVRCRGAAASLQSRSSTRQPCLRRRTETGASHRSPARTRIIKFCLPFDANMVV